jgi:PAS domain S-box-containing protein
LAETTQSPITKCGIDAEQYRIAFQFVPTGMCLVALDGSFVSVNHAVCHMLGYEESELIGLNVLDLTLPEDVPATRASLDSLASAADGSLQFERRYVHRQGHPVWVTVTVQLLRDEAGEPQAIIAHIQDISERLRAEAALRESEARFRIAFDNAPTGMSIIASNGSYIAVNPRLCRMFGYSREEFLGDKIELVTHPDDVARSNEWIRKKITGEACEEDFEKRFIHKDGHVVWGLVRAEWIKSDDGSSVMAVAHILDISERKRAEAALVQSEHRLREAHAIALLGHWTLNTSDGTMNCAECGELVSEPNESGARDAGRIRFSDFVARIHAEDRDAFLQAHQECVALGTPYDQVIRLSRTDGDKYIRVIGRREPVRATGPAEITGILQDVTAFKLAELERAKLETQLHRAQKMEAIGHLAGGIAHDFNNLLTAMGGNAALALTDIDFDSPLHSLLTEITKAVDSAANLTRQLLTFSRQQLISPKVLNLNEIVLHLQNMLRRLLGEDLVLHTQLASSLGQVRIDLGQAEQILVNLAVNARDAMPDGGRLTIETRNTELDEHYCAQHGHALPGQYVMLAVSDNGIGMTPEVKARIFEPFFTTKEQGKGTGLGLAMVYGAVRQNEGLIDVYSEHGQGTTFKIYLPRVDACVERTQPKAVRSLAPGREGILLVEDDLMVRALAQRVLERHGYHVHAFPNADAALAELDALSEPFELVITDVVMPGTNGRVFAERVRAQRAGVKVIFTSGYTQNVIAHHGILDAGIEFLPKPYTVDMLLRRVREVLDGQ